MTADVTTLLARIAELEAEIARHHDDFTTWEGMAARGAGQTTRVVELEDALRSVLKANVFSADDIAGPHAFGVGPTYASILMNAAALLPGDVRLLVTGTIEAHVHAMDLLSPEWVDGRVDGGGLTLVVSPELAGILERMLTGVGCTVVRDE